MSVPTQASFCTLENLLSLEKNGSLYGGKYTGVVTEKHKRILFDWLLEVTRMFKVRKDVWFYAVQLFNAVLPKVEDIDTKGIQLLGISCLMISGKKLEIFAPEISDYVYVCDGEYERKALVEMEKKVGLALNYNFELVNIVEMVRLYSKDSGSSFETHRLVFHLCRCYYISGEPIALPSLVVASAHYMASQILNTEFKDLFSIPLVNIDVVCRKIRRNVIKFHTEARKGLTGICKKELEDFDFLEKVKVFDSVKDIDEKYIEQQYRVSTYVSDSARKVPLLGDFKKETSGKLGSGTYGNVKKVTINSSDGKSEHYALKKTNYEHICDEGLSASFIRESSMLQTLSSHPNIIRLEYVGLEKLALELMCSDLKAFISKNSDTSKLPEFQDNCTKQLLNGLSYIHSQGCLIRDIKPQNILISSDTSSEVLYTVKYCDFGCARGCGLVLPDYNNLTREVVTLPYRPPELLLDSTTYGPPLDVWSLCCTLSEMCTDKMLFDCGKGYSEVNQLKSIVKLLGVPTEKSWPGVSSLAGYFKISTDKHEPQDIFNGSAFTENIKRVIRGGLIMDPMQRKTVNELINIFEDDTIDVPEIVQENAPKREDYLQRDHLTLWKEKYVCVKIHKGKSEILKVFNEFIAKNMSAKTDGKRTEVAVKLYEYISSEDVIGLFVENEVLRQAVAQKLLEFQKEPNFDLFKSMLTVETKEFIYALSGIDCK